MDDILTRRSVIRSMRARWLQQYADWHDAREFSDGRSKETIQRALVVLDLETCDRSAIDSIIGNNSWTAIVCSQCKQDVDEAVVFSDDEDSLLVCGDCLHEAAVRMGVAGER